MTADYAVSTSGQLAQNYVPFIVEGNPTGQFSQLHGRTGDAVRAGLFRVLEGEYPDREPTPYYFEMDEYIWIVEGEVHIDTAAGETHVLREGDCAYFRQGTHSTWTFHAPFRKFSIEIKQVNK